MTKMPKLNALNKSTLQRCKEFKMKKMKELGKVILEDKEKKRKQRQRLSVKEKLSNKISSSKMMINNNKKLKIKD